jgi:hypothetical protein
MPTQQFHDISGPLTSGTMHHEPCIHIRLAGLIRKPASSFTKQLLDEADDERARPGVISFLLASAH